MNQISDVLNLAAQAISQNVDAVLATVVHTEGSAYRRAGAMMLICEDGRSVGMISGGCLEPHIIKRAFWLTRQGASVQVYQTGDDPNGTSSNNDTSSDIDENDDLASDPTFEETLEDQLNFGLGCNGRIHVLFERLETAQSFLDLIRQVRETNKPIRVATLIREGVSSDNFQHLDQASPYQVGIRFNLDTFSDIYKHVDTIKASLVSTDTDDKHYSAYEKPLSILSEYTLSDKNTAFVPVTTTSITANNSTAPVQTQWLVQQIQPQKRLLICGAGNDVMPLVTMAKQQDWHVTVIDSRPQYARPSRFLTADRVICLPLEDEEKLIDLSRNAAVAVMSHSLTQDRARLKVLLQHPPVYLGQLGPSYRTERLLSEIAAIIDNPDALKAGVEQLHYPIGVKLGGDGPEALALGIMAQICAVMHGKHLQVVVGSSSMNDSNDALGSLNTQSDTQFVDKSDINAKVENVSHRPSNNETII